MATKSKQLFRLKDESEGALAKALSISFYPRHLDILAQRAKELNVPRSALLQLLLDLEATRGLVCPELIRRLELARRNGAKQPRKKKGGKK